MYCLSWLDPPTAPKDVKVDEIEPTSVKLSWKAPSDDGGSPIKNYVVEAKGPKDTEWHKVWNYRILVDSYLY